MKPKLKIEVSYVGEVKPALDVAIARRLYTLGFVWRSSNHAEATSVRTLYLVQDFDAAEAYGTIGAGREHP